MRKVFWMLRACAPFPQGSHLLSDGDCWKAIVTESQPILVRSFLFYPFLSFSILFTYEFAIEIQSEKVQILLRRFDADAAHTRTWALKIDLSHPFPLPASWLIEESAPKKHKTTTVNAFHRMLHGFDIIWMLNWVTILMWHDAWPWF